MKCIERTKVYKGKYVCICLCIDRLSFAHVRASARTEINPRSMTGLDRPRSKAHHLDSPLVQSELER